MRKMKLKLQVQYYVVAFVVTVVCASNAMAFTPASDFQHEDKIKYFDYQVESGDNVGKILLRFDVAPIWCSTCYSQIMIKLNSQKISKTGGMPPVGSWVRVPVPPRSNWNTDAVVAYMQGAKDAVAIREVAATVTPAPATIKPLPLFAPQIAKISKQAPLQRPIEEIEKIYRPPDLVDGDVDNGVRAGSDKYFWYRIRKNDTISEILYRFKLRPLWGPGQFVERTTAMNAGKVRQTGNQIDVNSWIRIPGLKTNWESPIPIIGREQTEEESSKISSLDIEPDPTPVAQIVSPPALPAVVCDDPVPTGERTPASYSPEELAKLRIPQALEVLESRDYLGAPNGKFSFKPAMKVRQMQVKDKARQSAAALSSDMNFDLYFGWQKEIHEDYGYLLGANLETLSMRAPAGINLISSGKLLNTVWSGFFYQQSAAWQSYLRLGLTEQLHLVSITETDLTLTKVMVPFADLSTNYAVFFYGPLSINIGGGVKTFLPAAGPGIATGMGLGGYAFAEERIVMSPAHVIGVNGSLEMLMLTADKSENRDSATAISVFWIWKPE